MNETSLINSNRISNLLGLTLDIEKSGPELLEFLILWNIFEDRLFQRYFTITKAISKNIQPSDEVLKTTFEYFKSRYEEKGATNSKFEKLCFRPNDRKENVANLLCGIQDTELNESTAIQCIIYRLRNNLFHGIKNIETLLTNTETFHHVNEFLLSCLEASVKKR